MTLKHWFAILVLLFEASSSLAAQGQWKSVKSPDGEFHATSPELSELRVELISSGGTPKILEWKKSPTNSKIWLLIYNSGTAGTSAIYRIDRAVVIDREAKKVLGDAVWKYHPVGKAPTTSQPSWDWKRDSLKVTDRTSDETLDLKF